MFHLLLHFYYFSCSETKKKYLEDVDPLMNKAVKIVANDTEKAEVSSVIFYDPVFMGKVSVQVAIWIRNDKWQNNFPEEKKEEKFWMIVYLTVSHTILAVKLVK